MPELRWHVRNKTEVASNSARRVTSTLAIYKECGLKFGNDIFLTLDDGIDS